MHPENCHNRFLHSTRAALLAGLLLSVVECSALAAQLPSESSSHLSQPAPVRIENVAYIVGLENKPGATGDLILEGNAMTVEIHGRSTTIPLRSILAFSIAHEDKPLIRGAKGKLAESAPYGIGFAVAMTRPSAETVALFYRDNNRAIHACVLVLPKGSGERFAAAVAEELSPAEYPKDGHLVRSEDQLETEILTPPSGSAKPSVEVALPSERIDGIPPAFPASVYEDLIAQLTQSGLFAHVWRAGDNRRTPDTLVLHLDIEDWRKGSARGRGFGPLTGATVIRSSITLEDKSGRIVFHGTADGTKRTNGENLEVTNSLAKHVRKVLEKSADLRSKK